MSLLQLWRPKVDTCLHSRVMFTKTTKLCFLSNVAEGNLGRKKSFGYCEDVVNRKFQIQC